MNLQAYPLYWPTGWKRMPSYQRQAARFSRGERRYSTIAGSSHSWMTHKAVTIADGVQRILESLGRMDIDRQDVIISTNVRTRLDGLPRSGEREPNDPGAAVYWRKGCGAMRCMAIDRYTTCADNLAAISATLEAMRAIERHGGAEILDRTFQGFAALSDGNHKPWREVLGFTADAKVSAATIQERFLNLAKIHHPDAGGDTTRFQEISAARDEALNEVK